MKTKLVIFGITGDLSRRKLLPALQEIVATKIGGDIEVIGASRRDVEVAELVENSPLSDITRIFTMDLARTGDYVRLKDSLALQSDEQAVIYLAVPPGAASQIVELLGAAGLNTPNVKLLFEKPFGFDYESAKSMIESTAEYFAEEQIYRIDHYMAKEVAQEIIKLRSNATAHHHDWGKRSIRSIEVVASETLGVKDRAIFYEQTGALRDVIQGHLMQLLSLVLMDTSGGFSIDELVERRLTALQHLRIIEQNASKRAQYDGYQQEVGNIGSTTETFTRVELKSDDPNWQGVPIRLITGKRLDKKQTRITVYYHEGPEDNFEEAKVTTESRLPDAYERVLVEAIHGKKYIFTSSAEVLRSWEIVGDIQEAWAMNTVPLVTYQPGATIDKV